MLLSALPKTNLLKIFMTLRESSWVPAIAALLPVALALASLIPYSLGRGLFIIPVLAVISVLALARFSWPKELKLHHIVSLFLGLYLAFIGIQIFFIHPEAGSIGSIKGLISLAMGWAVFILLTDRQSVSPVVYRWIERGLIFFALILSAQIFYSYYTGWGEIYDSREGIRRAFGLAGDNLTQLFVFFVLWALFRRKWLICTLSLTVLFMTGGRLALGLLVLTLPFAFLAMKEGSYKAWLKPIFIFILLLPASFGVVHMTRSFALSAQPAEILSAAPTQDAPQLYIPPSDPDSVSGPKPFLWRIKNLYVTSALTTLRGRLITFGAAYDMFLSDPLFGVGFNQSAPLFLPAALADRFHLKERTGAVEAHFTNEKFIANQYMITLAEMGLCGLAPFIAFALCCLALCIKSYRRFLRGSDKTSPQAALALASTLWAGSLIVAGQTVSWFLPAAPQALWLPFALAFTVLLPQD